MNALHTAAEFGAWSLASVLFCIAAYSGYVARAMWAKSTPDTRAALASWLALITIISTAVAYAAARISGVAP